MTQAQLIFWWTLLIVGVFGSALYSGLETGCYSLNRVRLHLLDHRGLRSARTLRRLVDNPSTLLGTLLLGNNIANYMGTASLAVLLEDYGYGPWQVIMLNVVIVTPILFVFGETLPKDLFVAHADRLMYPFAGMLDWSRKVLRVLGLLPMVTGISNLTMRLLKAPPSLVPFHPRRLMGSLVRESVGYGLLSDEQSALVERVLSVSSRRVEDEMVPWKDVTTVSADDPPDILWNLAERSSVSRFPVLDEQGQFLGVVSLYEALAKGKQNCPPVRDLIHTVPTLDQQLPSRKALERMQAEKAHMAIVTEQNRPVGIVTIKDLVEPITGELASW